MALQRPSPSVLAPRAPRVTSTVAPLYPRDAAVQGREGSVTLEFEIDARGRARRIEVLSASESGVFEQSAIAALRGWRFDPAHRVEGRRYAQAFEFALDGARGAGHACETPLGSRICR